MSTRTVDPFCGSAGKTDDPLQQTDGNELFNFCFFTPQHPADILKNLFNKTKEFVVK